MNNDPKETVAHAYDYIADWYLGWVETQRSPRELYANKILENSPPSPRILELGCGPGVPITRMLLDRGAQVVANDISSKQLSMAKERCPQADFVPGDMATLSFDPETFDGVICFYTMFHLPRAEQKKMLSNIYSWLKTGGLFVCNLATVDEEEIHGEMMGYGMFWSSYGLDDNEAIVKEVGFEIVEMEVREAGDGQLEESDADYQAKFIWIAARKGA